MKGMKWKRRIAFLMAFVMIISGVNVGSITAKADTGSEQAGTEDEQEWTIRVSVPDVWVDAAGAPEIYIWDDDYNVLTEGGWPPKDTMTEIDMSENLYGYKLPDNVKSWNMIFYFEYGEDDEGQYHYKMSHIIPVTDRTVAEGGIYYISNNPDSQKENRYFCYMKEVESSGILSDTSVLGANQVFVQPPNDWKSVYLYSWDGQGTTNAEWPGVELTETISVENKTLYKYNQSTYSNVIINDGNARQTINVRNVAVEDGKHYICNVMPSSMIMPDKGPFFYPYYIQEETTPSELWNDTDALGNYQLFVQPPSNWENAYVYTWDGKGHNNGWPGKLLVEADSITTTDGKKLYCFEMPGKDFTNIIINNGKNDSTSKRQTADIENVVTENGKCYIYSVVTDNNSNVVKMVKTVFTRVYPEMISFDYDGDVTGSYVYNGKLIEPEIVVKDGENKLALDNYKIFDTSTRSATAPGTYTVTIKGDDIHYIQSAAKTWEITKAPLTITANPQAIYPSDNIQTGTGYVTVSELAQGDTLESISFEEDRTNGKIKVSNAVIKNSNSEDVSSYYNITYNDGTLTVNQHEHNWQYVADGNVVEAYCKSEVEKCDYYGTPESHTATAKLTLDAADETYNGETYTAATVTNEITSVTGGEAEITYYKAKSANSVETDGEALSSAPTEVGNYVAQVTIGGATAKKAFTISKRKIVVKANDQSITYGESIKTGTDQVTVSSEAPNNLVSGHSLSDISLTVNGEAKVEDPGTIKPSNARIKQGTTDVTDNYQIEYGDGALTVAKAKRTFTAEGYNGVYDGKEHSIQVADAKGLTITYNESAEGEFTASNPSYKDAGSWTVYYMVQGDDNYEDFRGSEDITITQRDITISDIGAKDKVYDGTTNAELVYDGVKFDGIVDGDKLTVEATGKFEDANVGNGKSVMITNIILGGEDVKNYLLADKGQQTSTTADIKAKEIISAAITGFTVPKKGEEFVKEIACATEGVTGTPVVSYTKTDGTSVTGNAESNTKYVLKVTLSADSIHAFADNMTATVDGKTCTGVTKNADGTVTLSYDFKTAPAIESVTAPQSFTFTEAYKTKEAAAASSELPKKVKVKVQDAENDGTKEIDVPVTWSIEDYDALPEKTNTFTWTIDTTADALKGYDTTGLSEGWNIGTLTVTNKAKSDVEISSVNKEVIYEGTQIDVAKLFTIPEGAGEAAYTLIEDSAEGQGTGTLSDGSKLTVSTVGTFKIKVITAATDYYKAGSAEAVLTVKKGVGGGTVTIAESIRYGQTITPSVTSSTNPTEGVVYEYNEKNAGIDQYSEIVPAAVGEYTVRAKFPAGELYDEAYSDEKKFAIVSTDVVITAKNASITYDGTEYDLGKLFEFGKGCGEATYTIATGSTGAGTINGDKLTITKAGDIKIHVATAANGGNNAGSQDAVLKVNKASLTVTAKANTITYGDKPAGNGVTYSGYAEVTGNSENAVAMVNGIVSYTSNYVQYGDVTDSDTSYTITPQGLSSDVYEVTYKPGTLTVNPKTVTVTWSSEDSFTYDGSEKSVTAEISGTVNGDTISVEYDTDTSGSKQNTAVAVGNYTAVIKQLSGDKAGNYNLNDPDTTKSWKITKAGNSFTTNPSIEGWTYGKDAKAPNGAAKYGTISFTYSDKKDGEYTNTVPSNAGNYYMKAVVAGTGDYDGLESDPLSFTVTAAELTVKADDKSKVFGAEDPTLTYRVSGLVSGDKEEEILTGKITRAAGEDVKEDGYAITQGTLAVIGNNYKLTFTNGVFRINKANQAAPSGLDAVRASSETASDGKITGVTEKMEYRKGSTGKFTPITGKEISGLKPGTYEVRYVEDAQRNASPVTEVTVGFEEPQPVKVTGVSVTTDKNKLTEKGETAQLTVTVEPENAENKNVSYSTSDERIVTVDNTGKVTAVGDGTATITVTTEDGGKTATVDITVEIPKETPQGDEDKDSETPKGDEDKDSDKLKGDKEEEVKPANQVTSGGKVTGIDQLKEDNKNTVAKPGSIADGIGVEEVITRLADETTKTELIGKALTNVDTGSLAVEVIVKDENKINGKLDTTDQDTVSAVVEPQELVDVMTGTDIKLELIIEAVDEDKVNEDVIAEIVKQKKENDEIMYFDVDLLKIVSTTTDSGKEEMTTTVTELGEGIEITVDIPQYIRKEGRSYRLIRTHKNLTTGQLEVDELPDLDNDPYTYTIMTDKLCTMALAYNDTALDSQGSESEGAEKGDVPQKGDTTKIEDLPKEPDPLKTGTTTSETTTSETAETTEADQQTDITEQQIKENELVLNAGLKVSQTKSKITVKWGKIKGADGYDVYAAYCGDKFNTTKPTKSVKKGSVTSVKIKKLNGKKLKLKKNYKIYVVAYKLVNGNKIRLAKSICAHIVGVKNTNYTNVKRIKLKTGKFTLMVGKTATIKAKTVLVDKKKKQLSDAHAKEFRYASSDTKVATVNKKGKITAKEKGTCIIYVYARNGYAKKVKVTVK